VLAFVRIIYRRIRQQRLAAGQVHAVPDAPA
jgi:hypothetical protein